MSAEITNGCLAIHLGGGDYLYFELGYNMIEISIDTYDGSAKVYLDSREDATAIAQYLLSWTTSA